MLENSEFKNMDNMRNRNESDSDFGKEDFFREEIQLRDYFLRKSMKHPDMEEALREFHLKQSSNRLAVVKKKNFGVRVFIGLVAACLLAFVVHRFWSVPRIPDPVTVFFAQNTDEDVTLRDSEGAVLSLENVNDTLIAHFGATLHVGSKTLSYEEKSAESISMQILTTPRKKDFKVILSDGSEVWLNAESRLTYPSSFADDKREVYLEGEAYFKVSPDKKRPFIVRGKHIRTSVLGTEFNLRNYSMEDTHVTLVEGSVEVQNIQGGNSVKVRPGQKVSLNQNQTFSVREVNTLAYTEWKNGYFYFDETPLVDVMTDLGRWYDVDVVFLNQRKMNLKVHFVAGRKNSLQHAIDLLNSLHIAKVTLTDGCVLVD